jgi:hypothetical protein
MDLKHTAPELQRQPASNPASGAGQHDSGSLGSLNPQQN